MVDGFFTPPHFTTSIYNTYVMELPTDVLAIILTEACTDLATLCSCREASKTCKKIVDDLGKKFLLSEEVSNFFPWLRRHFSLFWPQKFDNLRRANCPHCGSMSFGATEPHFETVCLLRKISCITEVTCWECFGLLLLPLYSTGTRSFCHRNWGHTSSAGKPGIAVLILPTLPQIRWEQHFERCHILEWAEKNRQTDFITKFLYAASAPSLDLNGLS